jgi:curved DNA-binding protein CbpA
MVIGYYRILGVLDDAEDIVIKAAYRALAQKYHPDRWQGNPTEATRRMAEINAAYAVLSDPDKRRAYDATRDKSDFQDDSADADDSQDAFAAIDKDWAIATKYKPELIAIEAELRRIARELGTTFKLLLLEHKNFDNYRNVAEALERTYLKKYFGSTQIAQDFAKELILEGRRDAARELNQTVRVLGNCDREIVARISVQFKTGRLAKFEKIIEAERRDSIFLIWLLVVLVGLVTGLTIFWIAH